MRFVFTIWMLLLSFVAEVSAGQIINGLVKKVADGDTVTIVSGGNRKLKVRLYGIDAPETKKPRKPGQAFGEEAKQALSDKIIGRLVSLEIVDKDQYKRVVGIIRYAGRDINQEMIAEGMAWAYRSYLHTPYASEYINAESVARLNRKGLWRDKNQIPPWEFRHRQNPNKHSKNKHRLWFYW